MPKKKIIKSCLLNNESNFQYKRDFIGPADKKRCFNPMRAAGYNKGFEMKF
jgi:hypothetical protein